MPGLGTLHGRDLVAALVVGGFRVARRERGLALLVRKLDAVVVPEELTLDAARVAAIVERAGITEDDVQSWLSVKKSIPPITGSGFYPRVRESDAPPSSGGGGAVPANARTLEEVVRDAQDALARAEAAHERTRAVRAAIDRWQEALREVEQSE